jgi:hypothetical protein
LGDRVMDCGSYAQRQTSTSTSSCTHTSRATEYAVEERERVRRTIAESHVELVAHLRDTARKSLVYIICLIQFDNK